MKKLIKLLCILTVLFLTFPTQLKAVEENNPDATMTIVMTDENGNETEYQLHEGEPLTVPVYMQKEGSLTRDWTACATLTFFPEAYRVNFKFTPFEAFKYKTLGFTGSFNTTDAHGQLYMRSSHTGKLQGAVSRPQGKGWRAILVGSYLVTGYNPSNVSKAYQYR